MASSGHPPILGALPLTGYISNPRVVAMDITPADTYIGIAETARRLGVSHDTIRRWERDGKLSGATRTIGGQRRFPLSEIERLQSAAA